MPANPEYGDQEAIDELTRLWEDEYRPPSKPEEEFRDQWERQLGDEDELC